MGIGIADRTFQEKHYSISESLILRILEVIDVATHPLICPRDLKKVEQALRTLPEIVDKPHTNEEQTPPSQ